MAFNEFNYGQAMSADDVFAEVGNMEPRDSTTREACVEHYSGENRRPFWEDEPVVEDNNRAPWEVPAFARPARLMADVEYEFISRITEVEEVVSKMVAAEQWTSDMPWRSGSTVMTIGEMTDRHLANAVGYCQRRSMWRSMATLIVEQRRRLQPLKLKANE